MSRDTPSRERWRRIEEILDAVLDAPPDEQNAVLDRQCAGDRALRGVVERLLEAGQRTDGFLETSVDALPGRIGRYEVERVLGRGGMGIVYVARDPLLDRPVALKLLPPFLSLDPEAKRRFVDEAKAASALDHPHVATVYEIGETAEGRLFLAMAYYQGESLKERLRRGPLSAPEAAEIAAQVAEGLAAVHGRGILHRDIKPGNIVLTREGTARIVDFGIAKAMGEAPTRGGATLGTAAYMSPEQTRGDLLDERTDLWSLGVVLYEMLTGTRPFRGDRDDVLIHAIRNDEPERLESLRPDLPPGLAAIVHRCLAKAPDDRYRSAPDLARDLTPLRFPPPDRPAAARAGEAAVPARGAAAENRKAVGRRTATAIAVAVAALLAIAIVLDPGDDEAAAGASPLSALAVLPVVPVSDDTALARLGRELAVTLSASLDGIGDIRTAPAASVLAYADEGILSPEEWSGMARRLGAGRVLHGSLLRSGDRVRLDLVLSALDDREPPVRAIVTGPAHDIVALTDSASLALVRLLWEDEPIPVRSLSEVTTRSVPALRAYLEGEAAFARGDFREAVRAYERAFAEDSSFSFAYWRSLYPRTHAGPAPDSAALEAVFAHRDELPERERLLVESHRAETTRDRIAILRRVTQRFPDYWPAWWAYADELVHRGPYAGTTSGDAVAALERTVELHPGLAVAWEHLFWVAVLGRDAKRAAQGRERLEQFAAPGAFRFNSDMLPYLRALDAVLRSGGEFTGEEALRIARAALAIHAGDAPIRVEALATGFVGFGFPRAQLQFAEVILAEGATGELAAAQSWGRALAWAARGAWARALEEADAWTRRSGDPTAGLRTYGLAVVGAALGEVDPGEAAARRTGALHSRVVGTPGGRAELAWLDGVVAYLRRDARALARAAEKARRSGAPAADRLARSLDAFGRDARGDRAGAARDLAGLEEGAPGLDSRYGPNQRPPDHPHLSAVHRLVAARWLLAVGDTARAARLLTWHDAIGPMAPAELVNRAVEPLALLERARLAEARGREAEARAHLAGFLERYDLPSSERASWVEEALGALRRLSPPDGGEG